MNVDSPPLSPQVQRGLQSHHMSRCTSKVTRIKCVTITASSLSKWEAPLVDFPDFSL